MCLLATAWWYVMSFSFNIYTFIVCVCSKSVAARSFPWCNSFKLIKHTLWGKKELFGNSSSVTSFLIGVQVLLVIPPRVIPRIDKIHSCTTFMQILLANLRTIMQQRYICSLGLWHKNIYKIYPISSKRMVEHLFFCLRHQKDHVKFKELACDMKAIWLVIYVKLKHLWRPSYSLT